MWVLVGLILSFAIIIIFIREERSFGIAILLGSGVLALFSQQTLTPTQTFQVFKTASTSIDTLALTIGVALIGILANLMKETGQIEALIQNVRTRVPKGGILIAAPTVFGLLPIPGGALLSAPIVDEEGIKIDVSKRVRVFLNLWFRHIVFIIFPLAPPLLLLAQEANIGLHWLIIIQIPIFFIAFIVGGYFLWNEIRKKQSFDPENKETKTKAKYSLTQSLSPIIVSVIIFFLFSYIVQFSFYLSLLFTIPLGILTSLLLTLNRKKINITQTVKEGISLDLALAVFGILIFYNVVQSSGLSETLSEILLGFLPLPILIILISSLLGFSMGHNLGAVGISYSILAPLISGNIPLISLLYVSAFFGYLISPIHLCVAVSFEFFDPELENLYKIYLPAAIISLTLSAIYLLTLS